MRFLLLYLFLIGCVAPSTRIKKNPSFSSEKSFVILIPTCNQEKTLEATLTTALTQNYPQFRVVVLDDGSTDQSIAVIHDVIARYPHLRVEIETSIEKKGSLHHLYHAIHQCKDEEIVLILEGSDLLAHPDVLNTLNKAYNQQDIWMTYGNFLSYPSYTHKQPCKAISNRVIQTNSYRKKQTYTPYLHTFYAALFKQIKLHHFIEEKAFISSASAYLLPMLEMAGKHAQFLSPILYLHRESPQDNPTKISAKITKTSPYKRLKKLPPIDKQKPSILLVALDPSQNLLERIQSEVQGYDELLLLQEGEEMKPTLLRHLRAHSHVIFITKDLPLSSPIQLTQGLDLLLQTKAYSYSFIPKENPWLSLKAASVGPLPTRPPLFQCSLYRSKDVKKVISKSSFHTAAVLEKLWQKQIKSTKVMLSPATYDLPLQPPAV